MANSVLLLESFQRIFGHRIKLLGKISNIVDPVLVIDSSERSGPFWGRVVVHSFEGSMHACECVGEQFIAHFVENFVKAA